MIEVFWKLVRGPLEKLILGGIGGMILAVPALDLPEGFVWVAGALIAGLTALKLLADKIDPQS